jgi:hypothetical protein
VKKVAILLLVLTCFMMAVRADTVTMKDGTVLKGRVLMATSSSVLFETEDGKQQRIKATDFSAYSVGSKTDLTALTSQSTTQQSTTQSFSANSTTQQGVVKPKTISDAYQELKERVENEIQAYNKEVEDLTQVQKKKKLKAIFQKIVEIKKAGIYNVSDCIRVGSVESKIERFGSDASVYVVNGRVSGYDRDVAISVGKIAEKLNKNTRYKFTGVVSFDVGVCTSVSFYRYYYTYLKMTASDNESLVDELSAKGALRIELFHTVKSCLVSIIPVDEEIKESNDKSEVDLDLVKEEYSQLLKEYHNGKNAVELDAIKGEILTKCKAYIGRSVKCNIKIADILGGDDGWYTLVDRHNGLFTVKYKRNNENLSELKKGQTVTVSGLITSFTSIDLSPRDISGNKNILYIPTDVFVVEIRDNK